MCCALPPKQQQPKPQTTQVVASFSASQTPLSSAALPALAAVAAAAIPAALSAAAGGGLLGGAAAAAGGAVATSVWFCIACVASLGLLAPLAVNYVIGAFRFNPQRDPHPAVTSNQHPTNQTTNRRTKQTAPAPPGEAAELACEKLSLDSAACMDLFVGALGVAMVLSLLCAVPIFKVCLTPLNPER